MNGNASHLNAQSIIKIDPSFLSRIKFLSIIKRLELISRLLFIAFNLFNCKMYNTLNRYYFINRCSL